MTKALLQQIMGEKKYRRKCGTVHNLLSHLVPFRTLRVPFRIEVVEMKIVEQKVGKLAQGISCRDWQLKGLGIHTLCPGLLRHHVTQ